MSAGSAPRRPGPILTWRWALGALMPGIGVLVIALSYGGGAPQTPSAGLPDSGKLTGWGLPVLRLGADMAAFATVGAALLVAFLTPKGLPFRCVAPAIRTAATVWALLVAGEIVLTRSDLVARPPAEVLRAHDLGDLVLRSDPGRALGLQLALAVAISLGAAAARGRRGAALLLMVALAGLAPQAFTGHAAQSDGRPLAVTSLLVHVLAAALWVGGLAAIAYAGSEGATGMVAAVPRFSTLAAGCFAVVALSGVLNAAVRLPALSALMTTTYGVLVLGKVTALAILAALGRRHRLRTVPRLVAARDRSDVGQQAAVRAFVSLAAAEMVVMTATIGLAVALTRTPTS